MLIADSTLVGQPSRSSASCNARALMTVPSMPMVSEVARSMPSPAPVVPRQMLPPPTTIAICTSSSSRALAISLASRATVEASIVSSEEELASASPESLSTIRCHRGITLSTSLGVTSVIGAAPARSRADNRLSEANELRVPEQLPYGLLFVLDIGLIEQDPLLVPALEAPIDDLVEGGLGLAFVAGDRGRRLAEFLDQLWWHVLAPEVFW